MATLPGAWRYRVSAGTGWPVVSILRLDEIESLTCNFYRSVAARKIVGADPSLGYTTNKQTAPWLSFRHGSVCVIVLFESCFCLCRGSVCVMVVFVLLFCMCSGSVCVVVLFVLWFCVYHGSVCVVVPFVSWFCLYNSSGLCHTSVCVTGLFHSWFHSLPSILLDRFTTYIHGTTLYAAAHTHYKPAELPCML